MSQDNLRETDQTSVFWQETESLYRECYCQGELSPYNYHIVLTKLALEIREQIGGLVDFGRVRIALAELRVFFSSVGFESRYQFIPSTINGIHYLLLYNCNDKKFEDVALRFFYNDNDISLSISIFPTNFDQFDYIALYRLCDIEYFALYSDYKINRRVFELEGEYYIFVGDNYVNFDNDGNYTKNIETWEIYCHASELLSMVSEQCGNDEEDDRFIEGKYNYTKRKKRRRDKKKCKQRLSEVLVQLEGLNLGSSKKNTKKNFIRKLKTQHIKIQAGSDNSNLQWIQMIEKLAGFYLFTYFDKPLFKGISAILLLFNGSICVNTLATIKNSLLFLSDKNCTLKDLVDWLKSSVTNLESFKNNKYARSFFEFIYKCTVGLLSPSLLTKIESIASSVVPEYLLKLFSSGLSPIEAALQGLTYIMNGVDIFLTSGTLDGFISTLTSTDDIVSELAEIRILFNLYQTGDMEFVRGFKTYEFKCKLKNLLLKMEKLRKSKRGIELKQVDDWIKEVQKMGIETEKVDAHNKVRVQPFRFILSSGSGISKSHLGKLLCNSIAKRNGIPFGPEYMYFLNQANSFQSGWQNFFTIIFGDDTGAMLPGEGGAMNTADWTLRSGNNAKHELLGADLSEKGTLFNRALIEGWTSNSVNQNFHTQARFVSALYRRFQLHIVGRVKPEYTKEITDDTPGSKSTQIDYSKIPEKERDSIAPDAWEFDCYVVEIQDVGLQIKTDFNTANITERDNNYRYVPAEFEGRPMINISLNELLHFVHELSAAHFANQNKVLEVSEKCDSEEYYCECGMPKGNCNCEIKKAQKKVFTDILNSNWKFRRIKFVPSVHLKAAFEDGKCVILKHKVRQKVDLHYRTKHWVSWSVSRVPQVGRVSYKYYYHTPNTTGVSFEIKKYFSNKKHIWISTNVTVKEKHYFLIESSDGLNPYEFDRYMKLVPCTDNLNCRLHRFSTYKNYVDADHYYDINGLPLVYHKHYLKYIYKVYSFREPYNGNFVTYNRTYRIVRHTKLNEFENSLLKLDFVGLCKENIKEFVSMSHKLDYVKAQSSRSIVEHNENVAHVSKLYYLLKKANISDIADRLDDTFEFIAHVKTVLDGLISVFQDWFDEFICDVLRYFCHKVLQIISDILKNPLKYVPVQLEGTLVGAYCYMKHPLLCVPLTLDYMSYRLKTSIMSIYEPTLVCTIPRSTPLSDMVYDKYLRPLNSEEKMKKKMSRPLSPEEFIMQTTLEYSKQSRDIKSEETSLLRDMLIPICGSVLIVTKFIPALVSGFNKALCTVQVGHDMSIEQIQSYDAEPVNKWYLNKVEKPMESPTVTIKAGSKNVKNLVLKNLFYCKNLDTNDYVNGISFMNKYIVVPYHFVKKSIDKMIRIVKVPVADYSRPGNAFIEFVLTNSMVFKIQGDACVIYVEKYMDHMRTKDILGLFPSDVVKSEVAGSLYWKDKYCTEKRISTSNIVYKDECNNECISAKEVPKNAFPGYYYTSDNFEGLCGAALVDESHKDCQILGIHVGGNERTRVSLACIILRPDLEKAVSHFEPEGIVVQDGFDSKFGKTIHESKIYPKNPFFQFDRCDGIELLGTVPSRISPRPRVVMTPIADEVINTFKVKESWGPPPFIYNGDKKHGVKRLINTVVSKPTFKRMDLLDKAYLDMEKRVLTPLSSNFAYWSNELKILDDFEVVNGIPGKKLAGGMNMASAFSSHLPGPKSNYATQAEDGTWTFDSFVMEEYHSVLDKMGNGHCPIEMSTQMLKNEATLQRKIDVGKVRSFFMSCTRFQMVVRKFFLTTCRYFSLNTPYTETTVGINPHGQDWNLMAREFIGFENNNKYLACDLVNMDLNVPFEVLSKAIDLVFSPLLATGKLSKQDMLIVKCIKMILLYSVVNVSGDIAVIPGILTSGHPLTSVVGSMINSLYYRIVFYYFYADKGIQFHEACLLRTFSDDSIANPKTEYSWLKVKHIVRASNSLGLKVTGLDKKENTNISYYKLEELEFLKRSITYQPEFDCYVGPLNTTSMFKCLVCHVPPKVMSIEAVTGQCVDHFLFEAKFHGRKFYDNVVRKLQTIADKYDIKKHTKTLDWSFDQHLTLWKENLSNELVTGQLEKGHDSLIRLFIAYTNDLPKWSYSTQNTIEKQNIDLHPSVFKRVVALDGAHLLNSVAMISEQSGKEESVSTDAVENVLFTDASPSDNLDIGIASREDISDGFDLQEFFRRPVKLRSYEWGNVTLADTIIPFESLLANKRIANRVNNYKLFRATTKIKVVVNGNGFFSGRAMLAWNPLDNTDNYNSFSSLVEASKTQLSQKPHIWLDPTTSTGGEMSLPFFWPKAYYDLVDDSATGPDMGTLYLAEFVKLRHASQDLALLPNLVTITVYAWFEDVELEGLTNYNTSYISAQSGGSKKKKVSVTKKPRENETTSKPISQGATVVASAARLFSKVPVIAPYALAVEQAATLTSKVASALGYCKPVVVAEPNKVTPRMTDAMALTNTSDNCAPLSVDVKNQLSIDSRLHNLDGVDEMSISRIASVESYLGKFTWTTSDAVDDMKCTIQVTPCLSSVVSGVISDRYPTAVCGCALPFQYWTGTLVFKFVIVASSFHKGRLLMIYDPQRYNGVTTIEENTTFCDVVDIGETREIEIAVSNHQSFKWLYVPPVAHDYHTLGPKSIQPMSYGTNGQLRLHVLNKLTSSSYDPSIDTDIEVMVSVRAGEDFQLASPTDVTDFNYISPQSGIEEPSNVGGLNMTKSVSLVSSTPENMYLEYMGEKFDSFRPLLKRYSYYTRHSRWTTILTAPHSYIGEKYTHPIYPLASYEDENDRTVFNTLYTYLRPAFAAEKGSFRWKALCQMGTSGPADFYAVATRLPYSNLGRTYTSTQTLDREDRITNAVSVGSLAMSKSFAGVAATGSHVNPCLEFQIPFQSQYGFAPCRKKNSSTTDEWAAQGYSIDILPFYLSNRTAVCLDIFHAAGEDFNFMFFTGFPKLIL